MGKYREIALTGARHFKVDEWTCENCQKFAPGIVADNSAKEHAEAFLCFECIAMAKRCWDGELDRVLIPPAAESEGES